MTSFTFEQIIFSGTETVYNLSNIVTISKSKKMLQNLNLDLPKPTKYVRRPCESHLIDF